MWSQRRRDTVSQELPGYRPLTVFEWLCGRLKDFRRSQAARHVLCEHDETTAPCSVCSVRYW
ncbi:MULTISPECIES: hypothetical protein [Amycolatopsis]|uniref:hypothetical protein n=1 Tax=Amycolatopsis TaxID=1813 RepID=UPI00093FB71D|nr:hypothetical protein [Amycolatopsis sp. CB00013]OKK01447.1 hypothetical protein AMK34_07825 [Amycolatopsis sp. CB00013]